MLIPHWGAINMA